MAHEPSQSAMDERSFDSHGKTATQGFGRVIQRKRRQKEERTIATCFAGVDVLGEGKQHEEGEDGGCVHVWRADSTIQPYWKTFSVFCNRSYVYGGVVGHI